MPEQSHKLSYAKFWAISHDFLDLDQDRLGNFLDELIRMIEIDLGVFGKLNEDRFLVIGLGLHRSNYQ